MKCHSYRRRRPSAALFGVANLVLLSMTAWAAIRTHVYNLDGNLQDALGGPAMMINGGWLGPSGYHFFDGKGLALGSAVNPSNYSVAMVFYIKDISGWKKLVDFKNRASDNGLYSLNGRANFYPAVLGDEVVFHTNGSFAHVVLTRDGLSQEVVYYVNGRRQCGFVDTEQYAVFSTSDNAMLLFADDTVTGGAENPRGFVDRVELFEGALTPAEAAGWCQELPPRLFIDRFGDGISISWTNFMFGFAPETASGVSGGARWMPLPEDSVSYGLAETLVITNTATAESSFFRLRRKQ
jgi:hypothetical protein